MARQRSVTRQQAQTKKEQAVALMERIGEPERRDEYRDMTVEEYAEGRGLTLASNPRGGFYVPDETKSELNDKLDDLSDLIDAALDAELSREEVIGKIKEMRDVVESEEEEDEDDSTPMTILTRTILTRIEPTLAFSYGPVGFRART